MTREELYALLGHSDIYRDLDVKTLLLDVIREQLDPEEILTLFWSHLEHLDETFVRNYFYRRF